MWSWYRTVNLCAPQRFPCAQYFLLPEFLKCVWISWKLRFHLFSVVYTNEASIFSLKSIKAEVKIVGFSSSSDACLEYKTEIFGTCKEIQRLWNKQLRLIRYFELHFEKKNSTITGYYVSKVRVYWRYVLLLRCS